MSTYVGYVCLSHTPIVESDHWYNHGFERLKEALDHRAAIVEAFKRLDTYNVPPEAEWLMQHPKCSVVIGNEYGDVYDSTGNYFELSEVTQPHKQGDHQE
jgi:hypothetical protein